IKEVVPMKTCAIAHIAILLIICSLFPARRGADDAPDELARARAVFEKEIEFSTRPIRDRYISRLDSLKRSLGSRGDARGAAAVQDEIDRVQAGGLDGSGVARFAGVWRIEYTNGISRRYSILPDGSVIYDQSAGKPMSIPLKSKMAMKGNDFLVEWADGSLERLTISGRNLMVEHFNPGTSYPAGEAATRGVGKNSGSR
ncbi:MAG: hypothetical protein ABMA01_11200, partial [Chthoniobacteraceae bacterium]